MKEEFKSLIKSIFLFEGIPSEIVDGLIDDDDLKIILFNNGDIISIDDIFGSSLGVILSGKAVVSSVKCGKSTTIRDKIPGDVFGAASLFYEGDNQISTITSKGKSEIAFLSRDLVNKIITEDHRAAVNYIRFLSERVWFLNHKIDCFTAGSTYNKVAKYLHELPSKDNTVSLNISFKKLSEMLDIGRASLYRTIDDFEEKGLILREGKNIKILNKNKLKQLTKEK